MKYRTLFAVALLATGLCGCASNTGNQGNTPRYQPVENAEVPQITGETRFAAGQLAEARGDSDAAIKQYKMGLQLNKDEAKYLYRLGYLYAINKRYTESMVTWKHYLAVTGQSAVGYSNLAFTEELAGNPTCAEEDYKRGIAKDPTCQPCRVNYGLMLARHGRVGEATIQLQAVLDPAQVHFNIAAVYELQHRPEMAKLEYQKALEVDPGFKDAQDKLASLDKN